MTMTEFFIEPTDSDERYELRGVSAVDAFCRLEKVSDVLHFDGKIEFAFAELNYLPASIVWVLVDGLGVAHLNKQGHPGIGVDIQENDLKERIMRSRFHNVAYYDI